MADKDHPVVNITSNNQTGGITAHTVNFGKPQFELTAELIAEVIASLPRDRPIEVVAAGNKRAWAMGAKFVEALADAGHRIHRIRNLGMWMPPPEAPVSTQQRPDLIRVIIAPSA